MSLTPYLMKKMGKESGKASCKAVARCRGAWPSFAPGRRIHKRIDLGLQTAPWRRRLSVLVHFRHLPRLLMALNNLYRL